MATASSQAAYRSQLMVIRPSHGGRLPAPANHVHRDFIRPTPLGAPHLTYFTGRGSKAELSAVSRALHRAALFPRFAPVIVLSLCAYLFACTCTEGDFPVFQPCARLIFHVEIKEKCVRVCVCEREINLKLMANIKETDIHLEIKIVPKCT